MKKLRWVTDGEIWDVDMSTARIVEGSARGIPLGVSRGSRLSRAKQVDFMQRFMAAPFLPCFSPLHGFSIHRVLTLPLPFTHDSFISLLAQFNFFNFLSKHHRNNNNNYSNWIHSLRDKTLYALSFSSELSLSPNDNLLLSFEGYGDPHAPPPRQRAVFHHKFGRHNLTVETASPALFVDKDDNYWDVPLSTSIDLASIPSDSSAAYHLSMHNNVEDPKLFQPHSPQPSPLLPPPPLLPGFFLTSAFASKFNFDFWRRKLPVSDLKPSQPYDFFLSYPHVSTSATLGAMATASLGDNSGKLVVDDQHDSNAFKGLRLHSPAIKSALLADLFASVSFTAQHGSFQRLFLDLTRFHARMDFPSGSKLLHGAAHLAHDYFNNQQSNLETLQAICPDTTLSIQQQIAGPFSFRVDSSFAIDLGNRDRPIRMKEPVFALEYALQVLGSAKATAWYSPKHQEFMVELRFFER